MQLHSRSSDSDLDVKGIWSTTSILLLAASFLRKPTCITRFQASEQLCIGGEDDYVLTRGLVSDNNITISLRLRNCRITDIELEAFKNNGNLENLDLSRNKITHLKPGLLDGIPKLTTLNLSKNLLTTIPVNFFASSLNLQLIDISDNKIHTLQLGLFDSLSSITFLDLSGNMVQGSDLNPFLFRQNPNIKHLHLSKNNMTGAPDNLLSVTKELLVLTLSNCNLTEVPKFVTNSNFKILKQLRLQINKIQSLDDPNTFVNLASLKTLNLTRNYIENLNSNIFKPLSRLKSLDLSFNRIIQIPESLFYSMGSIKSIDLSSNLIEIAPASAFRRTNLDILDLSKNRISFLDKNFCTDLTSFYERRTFLFHDNPFQCACLLDILNDVKRLRIKYSAEKFNGREPVCTVSNTFTCVRNMSEFDDQQIPTSTIKVDLWSTFGKGYQLGNR